MSKPKVFFGNLKQQFWSKNLPFKPQITKIFNFCEKKSIFKPLFKLFTEKIIIYLKK